MASRSDQRRFVRMPIAFRARVIWYGGTFNSPQAFNVSWGGVLLAAPQRLPVGTNCHLVLFMLSEGCEYKVLAEARVARIDPLGLAFEFLDIRGEDSLHNLRTLILCHAPDPRKALEEMGPEAASLGERLSLLREPQPV